MGESLNDDYQSAGDYTPRVVLTMTNEYGAVVASGNNTGDEFASVALSFAGEAGRTYTATGYHRGIVYHWESEEFYPYRTYYFDTWHFTHFEAVNVYEPWHYYFTRPNYNLHQRRTSTVALGTTYDSLSMTEPKPSVTTYKYRR